MLRFLQRKIMSSLALAGWRACDEWNEMEKEQMKQYVDFCEAQIKFIKNCYKNGRSDESYPKAPGFNIENILKKSVAMF